MAPSRGRAVVLATCSSGPGETEAGGILCRRLNPAWAVYQDPASKQKCRGHFHVTFLVTKGQITDW